MVPIYPLGIAFLHAISMYVGSMSGQVHEGSGIISYTQNHQYNVHLQINIIYENITTLYLNIGARWRRYTTVNWLIMKTGNCQCRLSIWTLWTQWNYKSNCKAPIHENVFESVINITNGGQFLCLNVLNSSYNTTTYNTQIAEFMGPTWGPSKSCRPQVGPMLAPWTLLSGYFVVWHPLRSSIPS